MSDIPRKRYGETASGELEDNVRRLLSDYSVEAYGQQLFKTYQDTELWLRFENNTLQSLWADISNEHDPYRTLIYLLPKMDGFNTIETLIPRSVTYAASDDHPSPAKIIQTPLLDYVQLNKIGDVIDEVATLIDGDIHNPSLERILKSDLYEEELRPVETRWQRRLSKARRSAGYVMVSLHQIEPDPAWMTLAVAGITR